jgi:thioredoxin 1
MTVTDTSAKTFAEDVLLSPIPVLVDFWAEWCNPCRVIAPVLEQLAAERTDLKIVKVHSDDNSSLVAYYEIRSIPTLLLFIDGKVVHTMTGAKPKPAILKELEEFIP